MKFKYLFAFLLSIVAGLQSVKAQEAYAVYTSENTTLTFYYDNLKESRSGTVYSISSASWSSSHSEDITKVVFTSSFAQARPTRTFCWFNGMIKLTAITGISYLNTSEVTDMGRMFENCNILTNLDVSHFNTGKATDMRRMFKGCSALTSLDASNFNTANVTDMSDMFTDCTSLTSLKVNFDTRKVTTMKNMFSGCEALTILNLTSFVPENVTDMSSMFGGCRALKTVILGEQFNTQNVTDMSSMFGGCFSLESVDLTSLRTFKVQTMENMFTNCKAMTVIDLSNFSNHVLSKATMMFYNCEKLKTIYVGDYWESPNPKLTKDNSQYMFLYCTKLVGGAGTAYVTPQFSSYNTNYDTYSHLDSEDNPGFFTYKKSSLDIQSYNLWIDGREVNEITLNSFGNYINYNPTTKTLTLKGGTIQGNNTDPSANYRLGCGIYSEVDGLTIDVQGNTTVQGDYEKSYDGIYLKKNTTITGTAQLTGKGNYGIIAGYRDGSTNLTIGGDVTVVAEGTGSCGLKGEHRYYKGQYTYYASLAIKDNATVMAKGSTNTVSLGLWQDLTLDNCHEITAPSGAEWNASQHCVCYADGTLVKGQWVVIERTSLRGDVNLDKSVDIADAVCVLNAMAGQSVAGDANVNGDFDDNGNPVIDIADLVTVLNIMAGQ